MALCSDSVLTGQEGLIQFKPPGTDVCVRDNCAFVGDRIYLECGANFKVNDCVEFAEVDGATLDGALDTDSTFFVVASGVGAEGDLDACGHDMEGRPYISVAAAEGGAAIEFNEDGGQGADGEILTVEDLVGGANYGPGTYPGVELVSQPNIPGENAEATIVVGAGGDVTTVTITNGGRNYPVGAELTANPMDLGSAMAGAVLTGTIGAGTGYAQDTYNNIVLLNGTGAGAIATVTVGAGGTVTAVDITDGGAGYTVGDVLTAVDAQIGGGTGFTFTVATIGVEGAGFTVDVATVTDGGDSDLPAHINITLCDFQTVCQVRSFSLDLTRDELDVTTLNCSPETGCSSLASFRKTQAGFATATGELEVYFTCDQESLSQRLMGSSLLRSQQGATVRLFLCTNYDGTDIDLDDSLYVEAEINLLGMSFAINPDDPSTATINFGVTRMISVFGQTA